MKTISHLYGRELTQNDNALYFFLFFDTINVGWSDPKTQNFASWVQSHQTLSTTFLTVKPEPPGSDSTITILACKCFTFHICLQ